MVEKYITDVESNQVALAGGVALNCKLNKRIM
jgi:predicted NodU family carbamoyl transferase